MNFRLRSLGRSGSLGSWRIKGTDESTLVTDSSVPLMNYHGPTDLGALILFQIASKECTLSLLSVVVSSGLPNAHFVKIITKAIVQLLSTSYNMLNLQFSVSFRTDLQKFLKVLLIMCHFSV